MFRSMIKKITALFLAILTIIITAPFSIAETLAASPLGSVATFGKGTLTGTTIFAGDQVVAEEAPALVNLSSGSRIVMTKAAATFARQGEYLLIQASAGLLRFNFKQGEAVRINVGSYSFTTAGNRTSRVGELGSNRNGQIVMTVSKGAFVVVNNVNGERREVTPSRPFVVMEQNGQGSVSKRGKVLLDSTKTWQVDEHKGKCVVAGGEAHLIVGNSASTLTIRGSWKLATGQYDYKITDCTKDALMAAGATAASAGAAVSAAGTAAAAGAAAAGAGAGAAGISAATVAIAAAAGLGAAGAGLAIREAVVEKSPNAR